MPQRSHANGDVELLPAPLLQLSQRQIGLRGNPTAEGPVVLFQAGTAVTADLFGPAGAGQTVLFPKALHAFAADPETPAHLAGPLSALTRGDDPLTQILAQRPHNPLFMEQD